MKSVVFYFIYFQKIIEKFKRNEAITASRDIAIREFAIGENEIRLMYHYHPGQFSRATRMYVKPPLAERGERLVLKPGMTKGYNVSFLLLIMLTDNIFLYYSPLSFSFDSLGTSLKSLFSYFMN